MGLNKSTVFGHLACFGAYCIFGFNIVCCKNISNANVLTPMDLLCLRATGATLLFWLLSLFMPKEKVPPKDLLQIFVASMLGLFLTQYSFLKAITMTTSIDTSITNTCTPILTMIVAAIVLKEPITFKKVGGVLVSLAGVLILVFNSVGLGGGASETKPLGIVLVVVNGLTFALYLGIFRPLISRYNVVTFMKWMFLFSMIVALLFNAKTCHTSPPSRWRVRYYGRLHLWCFSPLSSPISSSLSGRNVYGRPWSVCTITFSPSSPPSSASSLAWTTSPG